MKKRALLILLLIVFVFQAIHAINYRALNRDSLRAIAYDRSLPDSTRLLNACYFTLTYDYVMPDSMLYFSRIFQEESVRADFLYGVAFTKVTEGWYYSMTGQKEKAMEFFLDARKPAEEYGQPGLLALVYAEIGSGYMQLQKPDEAIEFLLRARKINRELKLPEREASNMKNLASVYANSGNAEKAIEMLLQVVRMADSLNMDINIKSAALDQLGSCYWDIDDNISAVKAYDEALRLHRLAKNAYYAHITLYNMARFYLGDTDNEYGKVIGDDRKSVDIVLSYLEELADLSMMLEDTTMLYESYILMAKTYMMKGDRQQVREKIQEAKDLNFNITDLGAKINHTTELIGLYSYIGEDKTALDHCWELVTLIDSLDRVNMAEKVSQLTESFELEQMEGELSQKEQQLKNRRFISNLFIAISALILSLGLIVFYFLRQKQKAARLLVQQNREIEKARHRAEQSEKFKERFLASMSHEIRTPLNAVIGMTGLLLDEPQSPKTESYLKNIRQAGEHLTGIINEILDLSRIDAGKLKLHESPFSLFRLLDETENLLGVKAREKNLKLIIDKAPDTPDWVNGDSGRIRQVLLNLAGNAVKFTEQGSVVIKTLPLASPETESLVRFCVEDTGPGIPKELQSVIFEEFVQAGQGTDQKVAGTGLGLSIARKLVERMGGKLMLESEPGRGSVFSFTIPLLKSSEEEFLAVQKEKELDTGAMTGTYRILVVEDNPSNQIVTEGLLEKILPESKTVIAEDGFKALVLLEKEKFDLVLMDIRMPGIDGYETTRKLRQLDNGNAHIPVIALTASVIRADIQHCMDAGMNDYVPKPVSRQALAKSIREQLRIPRAESYKPEAVRMDNFLSALKERPTWADRLNELCNGKKERFVKYLEIFLVQSESDISKWDEWLASRQNEKLAFSLHKLLPQIRLFMNEKASASATELDRKLHNGWDPGYSGDIQALRQEIILLNRSVLAYKKMIE